MEEKNLNNDRSRFFFLLLAIFFSAFSTFTAPITAQATEGKLLFREEFNTLESWRPLTFPKISQHSHYTLHKKGTQSLLKAVSHASASGLLHHTTFDINTYPILRWRWRIDNLLSKGDATKKSGDDYPLRLYVIFQYEPKNASLSERIQQQLIKSLSGQYQPHSSLNYIWANKLHPVKVLANPYTDRAMMFIVRSGRQHVGSWQEEVVNMAADYQASFHAKPPAKAMLAIMSDSDDTGEAATAWLDYIEVSR